MKETDEIEDIGLLHVKFVQCEDILYRPRVGNESNTPPWMPSKGNLKEIMSRLGMKQISTVNMIHCKEAYGIVLESEEGWKVV